MKKNRLFSQTNHAPFTYYFILHIAVFSLSTPVGATDSLHLLRAPVMTILNANRPVRFANVTCYITQNDTTVCAGQAVTLSIVSDLSNGGEAPEGDLATGLKGWWPFNGDAQDASGNGNNGSVQGATLTSNKQGEPNKAYNFDGVDDQININHSPGISPTAQVSISAWVFPRAYEDNKHVISKGSHINLNYRSYALLGPHQDKKWQFWVNSGGTEHMVPSVSDALLNQWNHIIGIYDGSKMKLYINGVFEAEIDKTGSINQTTEPLTFGSHKFYAYSDYWFDGKIDNVGIWDRALSVAEAQALYNLGPATYLWSTGDSTESTNVSPMETTTYYVTVTNGQNSCVDSVRILVNPTPMPNIVGDLIFCEGDQTTLTASTGDFYTWSSGATTVSINVATPGTYTVTVSNANGCSATAISTVSVLNGQIVQNDTTVCAGQAVTLSVNPGISHDVEDPENEMAIGLKAWWPFNGNADDASGNGNNGWVQGATLTSNRQGEPNKAYNFDGVDDQININHSPGISPTAQVSISAWVFPRAYEDNKHVISKGSHINLNYRSYALLGPHQDKKWQFWVNSGGVEQMVPSVSDALLNQWNHIVGIYDGSKMKLYINGVFEAEIDKTGSINQTTEPLTFGSHKFYAYSDYWFDGKIDNVGIWDRALSVAEAQALYNLGPATYLWSTGATTASINVSPVASTKYYVTVTNDQLSCIDSASISIAQVKVSLKVWLQGPYVSSTQLMHDSLRAKNLIPLLEPYTGLTNFTHTGGGGGEYTTPSVLDITGNDAIVDWVFIELRSAANPALVLGTRSALLQRDGDVVDVDGISPVDFWIDGDQLYYPTVRHRNHLGVQLGQALFFPACIAVEKDFRAPPPEGFYLFNGLNPAEKTIGSTLVLWAGNGRSDYLLKYNGSNNDRTSILSVVGLTTPNAVVSGYLLEDYNLDGEVKYNGSANDRNVLLGNVGIATTLAILHDQTGR